jgi:hypothetical protein
LANVIRSVPGVHAPGYEYFAASRLGNVDLALKWAGRPGCRGDGLELRIKN